MPSWAFDQPDATRLVEARRAALARILPKMKEDLRLETALDMGCGVGYFSAVLRDMEFHVVGVDGRGQNVSEAQRRVPEVEFQLYDVEDLAVKQLGLFDLVLCFGLLYHLENPFRAIRNLQDLTGKVAVLESMCAPGSDTSMQLLDEVHLEDQGLNYVAFYPSEACLVKMLYRAGFPFVYGLTELPDHELYRSTLWQKRPRTMLVASKLPLRVNGLKLVAEPRRPWDIWSTPWQHRRARLSRLTRFMRKHAPQAAQSADRDGAGRQPKSAREMHMGPRSIDWIGRALRKVGTEVLRLNGIEGTWIDVGAHHGEGTLVNAQHNPGLRVYALEPNLRAAATLVGRAPNFVLVPMAVAEQDGSAKFFINAYDEASSMLPLDQEGLRSWVGGEVLKVDCVVTVPTIRLDTFMNLMDIEKVDFLKIDTQGMDLAVLRSAGRRLQDIEKINLEVAVTARPLYSGAPIRNEILSFLDQAGFRVTGSERQTHDQEENLTFVRKSARGQRF